MSNKKNNMKEGEAGDLNLPPRISLEDLQSTCPDRPKGKQGSEYVKYLNTVQWKRRKAKVERRDRGRCRCCGNLAVFREVHHLTYARLFCEPTSDLLLLCESCHLKIHREHMRRKVDDAKLEYCVEQVLNHNLRDENMVITIGDCKLYSDADEHGHISSCL
jgi:hypothetical protein